MSAYNPEIVRAVAIEAKAAVADLYAALLPLYAETVGWTLHCDNAVLPPPFDVRVVVEQYQALKIRALELRTWIETVKTAQTDDTYIYTDPCGGGSGLLIPTSGFMVKYGCKLLWGVPDPDSVVVNQSP